MGKNQAYKAMQRARLGGASGGPDEIEDGMVCTLPYYLFHLSRAFIPHGRGSSPFCILCYDLISIANRYYMGLCWVLYS